MRSAHLVHTAADRIWRYDSERFQSGKFLPAHGLPALTLRGAHSRASSPATARTGSLAWSGALRRPGPRRWPLRCSTPTRRAAPSRTGWPTGCLLACPAWRLCRPNAAEGVNDFGRRGYGGPCPPRGAAHHYHFVVLALDARLGLAAGARRSDLESRMRGHVLGRGELVATYQRG